MCVRARHTGDLPMLQYLLAAGADPLAVDRVRQYCPDAVLVFVPSVRLLVWHAWVR